MMRRVLLVLGVLCISIAPSVAQSPTLDMGAVTTAGPSYVTGTNRPISLDTSGNVRVNCISGCSAGSGTGANNADGVASVGTGLGSSVSYGYLYNGATWDRQPGSAANGATTNVKALNGTAISVNSGTVDAGTQRVTLASNGTGVVGLSAGANIVGKVGIDQTTAVTTNGVVIAPTSASAAGITPVVSASAESGHILKGSAGNLYGVYATNLTATAGFLIVTNTATVPADGAVTPIACVPLTASGVASINYVPGPPAVFATGISAFVSSNASCFAKTTGVITAFIGGQIQ